MANFQEASKLTDINEGGYSNSIDDHGGETYGGVARNDWPNWQGWSHIDTIKQNYGTTAAIINAHAAKDAVLQSLVQSFYKENFWDVNKLDEQNDQQIGNTVYDFGVNSGVNEAAKTLQECANVKVDGVIGEITINAINALPAENVYILYNAKRRAFYIELSKKPNQAQFLSDWLSRLKPYQTT